MAGIYGEASVWFRLLAHLLVMHRLKRYGNLDGISKRLHECMVYIYLMRYATFISSSYSSFWSLVSAVASGWIVYQSTNTTPQNNTSYPQLNDAFGARTKLELVMVHMVPLGMCTLLTKIRVLEYYTADEFFWVFGIFMEFVAMGRQLVVLTTSANATGFWLVILLSTSKALELLQWKNCGENRDECFQPDYGDNDLNAIVLGAIQVTISFLFALFHVCCSCSNISGQVVYYETAELFSQYNPKQFWLVFFSSIFLAFGRLAIGLKAMNACTAVLMAIGFMMTGVRIAWYGVIRSPATVNMGFLLWIFLVWLALLSVVLETLSHVAVILITIGFIMMGLRIICFGVGNRQRGGGYKEHRPQFPWPLLLSDALFGLVLMLFFGSMASTSFCSMYNWGIFSSDYPKNGAWNFFRFPLRDVRCWAVLLCIDTIACLFYLSQSPVNLSLLEDVEDLQLKENVVQTGTPSKSKAPALARV